MTSDQAQRLESFLQSLIGVPWFARAGRPSATYHVVADAVVAWDDWNAAMLDLWPPRSMRLEDTAIHAIGDHAVEQIFTRVDDMVGPNVLEGIRAYFARRPDTTENTACGADLGLRRDILATVLRDMSWAAVETTLETPGFFVSLLPVYQDGRWPCAWEGVYPNGRFVVL